MTIDDRVPAIWTVCAAFAVALVLSAILGPLISPFGRFSAAMMMTPLGLVSSTAPLIAAILTRRSPVPVFVSAIGLSFLVRWLLPIGWFGFFGPNLADMAIMMLVMFALTRIGWVTTDEMRRRPGHRMALRPWLLLLSALVFALPLILGMTLGTSGRGGHVMLVTAASAIIFVPVAVQILSGWIAALLADVPYAMITNRR